MSTQHRPQFSLKHVAYMVGVSDKTVRRWLKAGRIDGWQCGGRQAWYADLTEVNKMRDAYGLPALSVDEAIELHREY